MGVTLPCASIAPLVECADRAEWEKTPIVAIDPGVKRHMTCRVFRLNWPKDGDTGKEHKKF